MNTNKQKMIEDIMEKKEEVERKAKKEWLANIKLHWWLVIAAILITFIASTANGVSVYTALERCFYSGAAFWIFSEIIDILIKENI